MRANSTSSAGVEPASALKVRANVDDGVAGAARRNRFAVWTGIGAAGTAIVGMYWLGDTVSFWKLVWIALILLSVASLRWAT